MTTLGLNACIFLPSLIQYGGVLTQTSIGLLLYVFSILYATSIGWQAETLHVRFPSRALIVPLSVMLMSWIAWRWLGFDPLASKLALGLGASLYELLAIFWAAAYTGSLLGMYLSIKLRWQTGIIAD